MSFAAPILLLLAILRTPLFVIIALSAMIGFYSQDVDLSVISIEVYRLAEMPVLLAIPLFTFAGYLLGEGKASTRLVNLTNSLLGLSLIHISEPTRRRLESRFAGWG